MPAHSSPLPEPSRDELIAAAPEVLPGGNTRTTLFVPPRPPYAAAGEGFRLVDTAGHQVIDCNNNYTSLIHGHCHPAVTEAVARTLTQASSVGLPTVGEIETARELSRRFVHTDRWRFTNSGTEAVMMALRLARAVTGRGLVLRFEGSYHGSSDQVVDPGALGVAPGAASDTVVVPHEDEGAFRAAVREHGSDLAAVLIDLMPNRAGLTPRSAAFVQTVREETRAAGALLVLDEVITSRLETGGLQRRYDLAPDVTVLGKTIGGGYPIGAVGGPAEVMDVFDPGRETHLTWGGTFNANPVTMAAGHAALAHYQADAVADLNALGDELRTRLAGNGLEVTGAGSLMRIHSTAPESTWWRCYRAGVLLGVNGLLCLSTPMTPETTDEIATRLAAAL